MFCLNYYPFHNYFNEVDELKIKYKNIDPTLEDLLNKYKNKSIVIDVTECLTEMNIKLFKELYNKYNNIKLIIDYNNKEHLDMIKTYEIPFFFINPVTSIDQLTGFLKYHPTDMYICEELGFFLDKVSKILHDNKIKVRVFPNICQSSFSETPSLKTFFIRPEDIDIYSVFVDVFELISDESVQETLYKIYKQKAWFGKISEIIPSFKDDLNSQYILNNFGTIRTKCGKRCFFKPGSCNICERFIDLGKTFEANKIIIQKKKN